MPAQSPLRLIQTLRRKNVKRFSLIKSNENLLRDFFGGITPNDKRGILSISELAVKHGRDEMTVRRILKDTVSSKYERDRMILKDYLLHDLTEEEIGRKYPLNGKPITKQAVSYRIKKICLPMLIVTKGGRQK